MSQNRAWALPAFVHDQLDEGRHTGAVWNIEGAGSINQARAKIFLPS